MFISLTGHDNSGKDYDPIYINVDEIYSFYKEKGGSTVTFKNGKILTVRESPGKILRQLREQREG